MNPEEYLRNLAAESELVDQESRLRKEDELFGQVKGRLIQIGVRERYIFQSGPEARVGDLRIRRGYSSYKSQCWNGKRWVDLEYLKDLADVFRLGPQEPSVSPYDKLRKELADAHNLEDILIVGIQALLLVAEGQGYDD